MFFGYAYSRQCGGGLSPARNARSNGCSPFRNTNVPPEEISVVIGHSLSNGPNGRSLGKVSPTGTTGNPGGMAVTGGRTMKEYEDQLGALKKENFNLKLRIYFLEERMGVSSADEDAIKKNIELKVELESLRKELLEKQELLSQAAKAFELIEEQKKVSARNEAQYRRSLEKEQERIARLERELAEYREKSTDIVAASSASSSSVASTTTYRRETFGSSVLPDKILENEEKLRRTEELVASLEAEIKQVSASLEEERIWGQELEAERDGLRDRLEAELRSRDNLITEKVREIEELREKAKEEGSLERDALIQRYEGELTEKDRVIKEKVTSLEEKARAYEEATSTSERRKRQIDQLRASVKTRDDALTDLNNKHRALLSQLENGYTKLRLPISPTKTESHEKDSILPCKEMNLGVETLTRELDERERELKRQEESRKQLTLKLCNLQKHTEVTDQKLRKLEGEHEKAIKTIQGFMERQRQMEETSMRRERRIAELEETLARNPQEIGQAEEDECDRQPSKDAEKDRRIESLEKESQELKQKVEELEKLNEEETTRREELIGKRIEERDQKIEQLAKELQMKTQNLQRLVNTELWSKNREIAKLQNHATSEFQDKGRRLNRLVGELNDVGIEVSFVEDAVQLNYVNGRERIDVRTMTEYVEKLLERKGELEKEVDYLKWLRLVTKPDMAAEMEEGCGNEIERIRRYCELLRSHLKDLVKFMRDMLRNGEDGVANERKRIVLDVLSTSRILSEDFMHALEGMSVTEEEKAGQEKVSGTSRKSRSNEVLVEESRASQSDSEAFSEPDRTVSMARMGLRETRHKSQPRARYSKYPKDNDFSDSEDSSPVDCAENKEERKLDSSSLNRENESLRSRLEKLEEETVAAKASVTTLTKELDGLTLSHSQLLVENTKLTNDKLRLEQELRKTESRYDAVIRNMRDEFDKEMTEVNRINDSQRARLEELEATNKELGRHVAVCEASDSPSSSGVSSVRNDGTLKRACEDALQDFRRSCYSNSRYWLPVCPSETGSRRKANCSPDLGIESDAAVTTVRPLRDTLRITESMTNLLSDEDGVENRERVDSDSPSPIDGLDEVEALKQENDSLRRRLTKTRRALEDTFRHLSVSNKNKRNVEKAITKQLMITRSVLMKTRTYEESLED